MGALTDRLKATGDLTDEGFKRLLTGEEDESLRLAAVEARVARYGRDVYIRGLIEVSSYCKNNCLYCGIRAGNACAERYRLSKEEILACCEMGHGLGFRTFVLQGGEDAALTDEAVCEVVCAMRQRWPDCAVTLSLGERSDESYRRLFVAGAERYLLRHETADKAHYQCLHPPEVSFDNRVRCLQTLKALGFQTGCGFMVGSPGQTAETLVKDLRLIQSFRPEMVGIGPFLPHRCTPFAHETAGGLSMTLRLLSIIRLLLPGVLLPATTALATLHPRGREMGILAGANVVMPNLSPAEARGKYLLYDGKRSAGAESAEGLESLKRSMEEIGYSIAVSRGDARI